MIITFFSTFCCICESTTFCESLFSSPSQHSTVDVFIIEVLKMGDFKMFLLVFETFLDITVTHIKAINIVVKIPIKYHVLFMHLIL